MHDLNDMYYYVQAVDHGGFAPAGRALGEPKSKLSRRLAALEERLGVRLIQRSTRQFRVTEIGQIYYRHCKAMLVEADAAEQAVAAVHAEPCGTVRLSCPITLLHVHVSHMLADFMRVYPQVTVQLEATNRRVDVLTEGLDLAIRVRPRPFEDSELAHRVLSERGQCLVASPELVEAFGLPDSPAALAAWPTLARGGPEQAFSWTLTGPGGAQIEQAYVPRYITRDMVALQVAARAGVGVAQLPLLMVDDDLRAGRLVHVLPDWHPRPEIIHVVFASRRGLLPAVRCLIEHLAAAYASFDEA
ncbi:MAG: LysR family transcriptional regulator [Oceanococcaceae bacterium]